MATPTEWINEFQVNTGTAATGGQSDPKIAALTNGGFVVIWVESSDGLIGTSTGTDIIAKIYDADGGVVRDSYQLNSSWYADDEQNVDVTATHDGFAIAYIAESIAAPNATGVRYERFDLTGNVIESLAISDENVTADYLRNPQIAASLTASNDDVFLAYDDNVGSDTDITARVINEDGVLGAEFAAAQNSRDFDRLGDVAVLSDGNFVTVYEEDDSGTTSLEFTIRSADGTVAGQNAFALDNGSAVNPRVVGLEGGGFVATWTEGNDIFARGFTNTGSQSFATKPVASGTNIQNEAVVTALPDGDFVVAWDDDTNSDLLARRFNANGTADSGPITITDTGTTLIDIDTSSDGRILFTWLDEMTREIVASIWDPELPYPPTQTFARDDAVDVSKNVLDEYGSDWFRIGYAKNNTDLLANDAGAEEIVQVNGVLIGEGAWFDGDNGGQFRVFAGGVVDFRNQGVKVEDGVSTGFSYTASDGSAEDMANVSVTIDAGADIARDDVFEISETALNTAGPGWLRLGAQRGDTHLLADDLGIDELIFTNDPPLDEGVWFDGDNGGQFRTFAGGVVDFRNQGETVGLGDTTGFTYTVFQDGVLDTATVSMTIMETVPLSRPLQLKGIDQGDWSGFSVSSAGDVDGDGLDDVIIGAPWADRQGKANAGESYLVFGATLAAEKAGDGAIDLDALGMTEGILIRGDYALGLSGSTVSSAGDVDGDGLDDVIISAYAARPDGKKDAGASYLVFGAALAAEKTGDGAINFRALATTEGVQIKGIDPGDRSGFSVSSAGDIDGDGLDDVIIGAPWAGPDGKSIAGESYLVFGAALAAEKTGDGVIDLGALSTSDGIMIKGRNAGDQSGRSVSSAGDVDGDGLDDVIIGARWADPDGVIWAGESYLLFGTTLTAEQTSDGVIDLGNMAATDGIVIKGIDQQDYSGYSVSSAGDVDGDGLDDVIIGAYLGDRQSKENVGETYLVFGTTLAAEKTGDGVIDLGGLATTEGIVIKGIDPWDWSGYSVSSAGDVDGDGLDDMIIGAYIADQKINANEGESYLVFGAALAAEKTGDGVIDLGDMAATDVIIIKGIDREDYSGFSVFSAGDVDGDGLDDVIIGAFGGDPEGVGRAGESYIIFGAMLTEEKLYDGIIDLGDWFF